MATLLVKATLLIIATFANHVKPVSRGIVTNEVRFNWTPPMIQSMPLRSFSKWCMTPACLTCTAQYLTDGQRVMPDPTLNYILHSTLRFHGFKGHLQTQGEYEVILTSFIPIERVAFDA